MLSNIYLPSDSPMHLSLFVQNPDLDVPQTIYGRESLTKGPLRKITKGISLKTFFEKQPLSPSKTWYKVVKPMKTPGKEGKHPIHFWIPKDQDLKIGVLNQELMPIQNKSGVMQCDIFIKPNKLYSYDCIQKRLNAIFHQGQFHSASPTPPSSSTGTSSLSPISSKEIEEILSIPLNSRRSLCRSPGREEAFTLPASSALAKPLQRARRSPTVYIPPIEPLTSSSNSSTPPCASSSTALDSSP